MTQLKLSSLVWTRPYHILDVLVFWFIRGSCYSLPSTQRLSIKCGPMEAALWTFDCIIELTWARGLERKTSSNRERASSTPSFDDDAAKKSLSMNDLLRWKVLPTAIDSRGRWTKRCILYISFDSVRFMTKTNGNRRKSHYWTRDNSRQNSPIDFLNIQFSLQRFCFVAIYALCTNIYVVYYSIFRVKCRRCWSFGGLGVQRLQKIQVVLLLQQQVINPDIVGQVPCVGAFSVDCPSLHFTGKVCTRTRKRKLLSIFYTYIWGSFIAPNFFP